MGRFKGKSMEGNPMDYLLGIDIGSTSMKAVIYDLSGNVIAQASRPTLSVANDPEHPNWQVYIPADLWNGIAGAIQEAAGKIAYPNLIRAAVVTGLGADAAPLDEAGKPVYPFINWLCTRTTPQFDWWLANIGLEKTFEITGWQPFMWSTALRFMWLKENEPEAYRKTRKFLIVEDFINYQLTGKYSTDYTDASPTLLFDQRKLTWSDELLSLAGIEKDLLPAPQPSGSFIGEVTSEAAAKTGLAPGTPIFQGGHDYLIGALAGGILKPGVILDVTGTWELVLTPTTTPQWEGATRALGLTLEAHSYPGTYCLWGGGTAASMLEWYKDEIGLAASRLAGGDQGQVWGHLIGEASSSPPGAGGVFFLPHFNGTTCPNLDPRSLGAFVGLGDTTKRGDLVRAVIEGLDYAFVDMLKAVEQGVHKSPDRVIAIGGAVRNEFWMQNKADMSGIPVEVPEITEATALGAAMLAGVGVGLYKDLDEAAARVCKPGKVYEPDKKLTSFYQEMMGIYHEIYPALQQVNQRIYDRFKT
jgi:xylulokinase